MTDHQGQSNIGYVFYTLYYAVYGPTEGSYYSQAADSYVIFYVYHSLYCYDGEIELIISQLSSWGVMICHIYVVAFFFIANALYTEILALCLSFVFPILLCLMPNVAAFVSCKLRRALLL